MTSEAKPEPNDALQVGGHGGKLSMVFEGPHMLKPALSPKECRFYEALSAGTLPPLLLSARVVPRFFGYADRAECRYLVLENAAHGFARPCVLDLKLGTRTWDADCGPRKLQTHVAVDAATTTATLGFRFGGAALFDAASGAPRSLGRRFGADARTAADVRALFAAFLRGAGAGAGVAAAFARRLRDVRAFLALGTHRLFAASALFLCDAAGQHAPDVRLIDFAHAWYADEYADDSGALLGVENLIELWSGLAAEDNEDGATTAASTSSR